jgi:hypothetical protein
VGVDVHRIETELLDVLGDAAKAVPPSLAGLPPSKVMLTLGMRHGG